MKQEILDFITKQNGSVSFVELSREIAGFEGEVWLFVGAEDNNLVLWPGVSEEAAEALSELRSSGAIHALPTEVLTYLIDGRVPCIPLAKTRGPYKSPHWIPTALYPGPMPAPAPKVRTPRPNQIAPAKLDLASMSAADLRAYFEPLELCPFGFNSIPGKCAKSWEYCDNSPADAEELVRQVADAAEWLALCGQVKAINRNATSYGLKHECERWRKAKYPSSNYYVCNGALLMAAHGLGFKIMRPSGHRNFPNGYLNISKRRPKAADAQSESETTT